MTGVWGQLTVVWGQLTVVWGQLTVVWGQLTVVWGQLRVVWGQLTGVCVETDRCVGTNKKCVWGQLTDLSEESDVRRCKAQSSVYDCPSITFRLLTIHNTPECNKSHEQVNARDEHYNSWQSVQTLQFVT